MKGRFGWKLAAAMFVVAASPTAAFAAPPTLLSVGHTQMHPTAQWSLPPGAESRTIEVATNPSQGTDGSFFTENVVLFDVLENTQTNYVSSDRRLKSGITYYVHVASIDWSCLPCPVREWSNILTLTIPNVAPQLQSGRWNAYRFLRSGNATLQVCDDEGDYRVVIGQARIRRGRVVARASSVDTDTLLSGGCGSLIVSWSIPAKLVAVGDVYRVTFTVVDSAGARSRTLAAQARWRR